MQTWPLPAAPSEEQKEEEEEAQESNLAAKNDDDRPFAPTPGGGGGGGGCPSIGVNVGVAVPDLARRSRCEFPRRCVVEI
jgi:hypothetical protein